MYVSILLAFLRNLMVGEFLGEGVRWVGYILDKRERERCWYMGNGLFGGLGGVSVGIVEWAVLVDGKGDVRLRSGC